MAGNSTGTVVSMAADLQSGFIKVTSTDMLIFFNVRNAASGAGTIAVGASVAFDFAHKSVQSSSVTTVAGQNVVSYSSVDGGPAGTGQAINISVT